MNQPAFMTTPTVSVRHATVDDKAFIAVLMNDLGYQVSPALMAEKIGAMAFSENDAALVAILEDTLVGVISLHALPMFHRSGHLGRITSLVVAASRRGSGVGSALMASADAWFQSQKCVKVEVTSGGQRADAHRFYQRLGFEREGQRLAKNLGC